MAKPITTAHTKLKALIDAGITAESLGTITTSHDNHCPANLVPDTVSVDVDSFTEESLGLMDGPYPSYTYSIDLSVRIHTGLEGKPNRGAYNASLVDTLHEYVMKRRDLSDNYRIDSVVGGSLREYFDDSHSVGAQMIITVIAHIAQAQV